LPTASLTMPKLPAPSTLPSSYLQEYPLTFNVQCFLPCFDMSPRRDKEQGQWSNPWILVFANLCRYQFLRLPHKH
jgi:hypothetical protein